jgi:hypothetical protein
MSILFAAQTVQTLDIILPISQLFDSIIESLIIIIDIFYPASEPISHLSLRCSPPAAVLFSFGGHCLNLCERVGWVGIDS